MIGVAPAGRRVPPGLQVTGLGLLLVLLGVVLLGPVVTGQLVVDAVAPWWVLLVAFAAAEAAVLHTHVGRQVSTITSLTDVALVAGVFLADPVALVAARVAGAAAVQLLHRRSAPGKVAFNASVSFVDAALVVAAAGALLPAGERLSPALPEAWAGVLLGVAASAVVQAVAVALVIGVYEGRPRARALARECAGAVGVPLVLAAAAMVAVAGLETDVRFGWLVAAGAVVLVVLHRAYVRLWYRHLALERMVAFTTSLRTGTQEEATLRTVLERARDLLVAEQAHVHLLRRGAEDVGLTVSVTRDGPLRRRQDPALVSGWVRAVVVEQGTAALVARDTDDPARAAWLADHGVREAVVVPVVTDGEVVAVLWVGDRLSDVRAFDPDDLALLEAVAGQVGLALQNGRLREDLELQERNEKHLQALAGHDHLTGLANRRELEQRLVEELAGPSASRAALVYGDLDGFKPVNDRFGHAVGDEVLVEVAARLGATAGPDDVVARVGGDEFVVLCRSVDAAGLRDVVDRIERTVAQPVATSAGPVQVAISLGAVAARPDHDGGSLLVEADEAMFRRKRRGAA